MTVILSVIRSVSLTLTVATAIVTWCFGLFWLHYGGIPLLYVPVEVRNVANFHVADSRVNGDEMVRVTGNVGDGINGFKSFDVDMRTNTYKIIVYEGFYRAPEFWQMRPGGPSLLDIRLPVPSNVDRIAFGRNETVIWERKHLP